VASGYSKTLTFEWNTTAFSLGNYTVKAVANQVENETIVTNNVFIYGVIEVSILGDINADGTVNIVDLYQVGRVFQSKPGDPDWNPNVDLNEDGVINISDLYTVAANYGKTV